MTSRRDLKTLIRERMAKTGEPYTVARQHVLADRKSGAPSAASVDPQGWWPSLVVTTREEARGIVAAALERESRLTYFGIGVFQEHQKRRQAWLNGQGPDAIEQELQASRQELARALPEVAASVDWIKQQRLIGSFNRRHSSYGYKHSVERWLRGRGSGVYVANGAFIAAALGMRLDARLHDFGSPNMLFKFSERTVRATSGYDS